MRRALFVLVITSACGKKPAPPPPPTDAAPLILVPLDLPDPPSATRPPTARPDVDAPEPPAGHTYKDALDLPDDAGLARCPTPPGTRPAPVRLEMITRPKKTIDLVVPSLGVRKRLWKPYPNEPSSCYAALTEKADGLRFTCVTDEGSIAGKVYARGSDVIVGANSTAGKTVERFELPCGVRPRFEAIACPAACTTSSGAHFTPNECACPESSGLAPTPASTTRVR